MVDKKRNRELSNLLCSKYLTLCFVYPEPGSNRHELLHWCLRPTRLPIPPSGQMRCKGSHIFVICKVLIEFFDFFLSLPPAFCLLSNPNEFSRLYSNPCLRPSVNATHKGEKPSFIQHKHKNITIFIFYKR